MGGEEYKMGKASWASSSIILRAVLKNLLCAKHCQSHPPRGSQPREWQISKPKLIELTEV